jgi:hypothetical protein
MTQPAIPLAYVPLLEATRHLRNAAPGAYDEWVKAFETHRADITATVTFAPSAEILTVQGRIQEAHVLCRVYQEAQKPPTA